MIGPLGGGARIGGHSRADKAKRFVVAVKRAT
jgi:hypothetical protein